MPGVQIFVDHAQVERVNRLLSSVPEKATAVYRRAFDRGIRAARAQAAQEIRQRYAIGQNDLRTYETIRSRVDSAADGVYTVTVNGVEYTTEAKNATGLVDLVIGIPADKVSDAEYNFTVTWKELPAAGG